RDLVADLVVALDVLEVDLAEEVPNRRQRRNDVGLIAAVGDHVVGPLFRPQLLAAKVPADVHELDRTQRIAAEPGPERGVRGLALEGIFDGDQSSALGPPPRSLERVTYMGKEHGIDITEHTGAYEIGLGAKEFLGDARPHHDG